MTIFTKFLCDDSGAVTIDWVALTAGILLLGIAVVYGIFNGGVGPLKDSINASLSSALPEDTTTITGTAPALNPGG
jgi:hypothetical protein